MAQIRRDDFLGHTCGGVVAKMAVAAQDPLFDAPGPFQVILQHFEIVIGFEHQDIGFSNPLDDQLGGMAQIRKKPDVDLRSPKEKADRIISVMRHGKRVDAHVANIERGARFKNPAVQLLARHLFDRFFREAITIDGNPGFEAECGQTLDMIAVLVRDENPAQSFGRTSNLGEPLANLASTEPGIDEDSGVRRLQKGAIPP